MPGDPTVTEGPREVGEGSNGEAAVRSDPSPLPALREAAATQPVVERRRPAKPPKVPKQARARRPGPVVPPVVAPVEEPTLAPMSRRQRKRASRLRARKVKRIVRRVDAWSVLKIAFIFYLCLYVVGMVATVLLWKVAADAGVIDNIESFIKDLGAFQTFEFDPDKLLQGAAIGGAVLAVLATGLTALGAVLFNLISDLVGGIRMTMIEEPGSTPLARPKRGGRSVRRSDTVSEPAKSGL